MNPWVVGLGLGIVGALLLAIAIETGRELLKVEREQLERTRAALQGLRVQLRHANAIIDRQLLQLQARATLIVAGVVVESTAPAGVSLSRGTIASRRYVPAKEGEAVATWEAADPDEELVFERGGRLQLTTSAPAFRRVEIVINGTHLLIVAGVVL